MFFFYGEMEKFLYEEMGKFIFMVDYQMKYYKRAEKLPWSESDLSLHCLPVRIVKFANSLDDKLMIFFSFSQKIDCDILCKLYP